MRGLRLLFLASWVILLLLFVATALLAVNSLVIAYTGAQDNLTATFTLEQLSAAGGEEAVKAFRGRRATASTWALGCALLGALVVLIPYRRGERWAWWGLLVAVGLPQLLSLARALALGTSFGTGASATILAFLLLGLMAGAPYLFRRRDETLEV
jgi:hypothetical protein